MTVISAPDPELYGTMNTGDMSAGDLAYMCDRVLGHDPSDALINVLHVVKADADHLIAGTKPVPAPLAIALLRCWHGLPILKRVGSYYQQGKLVEMRRAKNEFVAMLNTPSSFSDNEDHVNVFDYFAEQIANYMTLRLQWLPDTDRW